MSISAIIVAAGTGTRLGGSTPKGFVRLSGKALFLYSLEVLLSHEAVADAVLVVPEGFEPKAKKIITGSRWKAPRCKTAGNPSILKEKELSSIAHSLTPQQAAGNALAMGFSKKVALVAGGKERWQSVEKGVRAATAEWVLVHDAARPFVTKAVVDAVLVKKDNYDCAITVTQEVDTIRTISGDLAGEIIERQSLVRVGTPQLFRRRVLLEAFTAARDCPSPPTDEAVLMQRMGVPVALAWGDPMNFKITTAADFAMAEALIAHRLYK